MDGSKLNVTEAWKLKFMQVIETWELNVSYQSDL